MIMCTNTILYYNYLYIVVVVVWSVWCMVAVPAVLLLIVYYSTWLQKQYDVRIMMKMYAVNRQVIALHV